MHKVALSCVISLTLCSPIFAAEKYNYRSSDAYRALEPAEREKLDQVHRDFVLLWGALDMYAEEHEGQVPESLSELMPDYLAELPRDPFATKETAVQQDAGDYKTSCDGYGYRYRPGEGDAYVLSTVGLRKFPYREGNSGVYITKGWWFGGLQFLR